MKSLSIAAFQIHLAWHDAAANRRHLSELMEAHRTQSDLIILPEMFTTGFSMEPSGIAEPTHGPTLHWMQQEAKKRQGTLLGSLIVAEGGAFFNRALWVGEEGLQGQYDKRHGFSLAGEEKVYRAGTEQVIWEWKDWKICPQICYDLRFPVFSRNRMDSAGKCSYDLLIYVANWPAPRVHHWESLLRARAIENQAFVVGVNRVGEDPNGNLYSGSSMIVDPMGTIIAQARGGEAVLEARLDPELLQNTRKRYRFLQDADDFVLKTQPE